MDIVSSDDIKIYYTGKFQDFTARYIMKNFIDWKRVDSICVITVRDIEYIYVCVTAHVNNF